MLDVALEVFLLAGRLAVLDANPAIYEGIPEWSIVTGETEATRVKVGVMVRPSERGVIRLKGWFYADGALLHAGTLDVDQSGFVNGVDFDLFVFAFEEGWPVADYDGDGFVTGADFDRFTTDFAKGSP